VSRVLKKFSIVCFCNIIIAYYETYDVHIMAICLSLANFIFLIAFATICFLSFFSVRPIPFSSVCVVD